MPICYECTVAIWQFDNKSVISRQYTVFNHFREFILAQLGGILLGNY